MGLSGSPSAPSLSLSLDWDSLAIPDTLFFSHSRLAAIARPIAAVDACCPPNCSLHRRSTSLSSSAFPSPEPSSPLSPPLRSNPALPSPPPPPLCERASTKTKYRRDASTYAERKHACAQGGLTPLRRRPCQSRASTPSPLLLHQCPYHSAGRRDTHLRVVDLPTANAHETAETMPAPPALYSLVCEGCLGGAVPDGACC